MPLYIKQQIHQIFIYYDLIYNNDVTFFKTGCYNVSLFFQPVQEVILTLETS